MKLRMRLALWLYPPAWRERYAREFAALIEDMRPGWREFWDVARGGLKMRLLRWNLANVTMACALIGAAIGGGWALRRPEVYISSAVVRLADGAKPEDLVRAQTAILSRGSLAELIARDDLFHDERMTTPMEDVIEEVRNKHIRIRPLETTPGGNWQLPSAVQISFDYPDRHRAQRFTRALSERFAASLPAIRIVTEASLPSQPVYPNRLTYALAGLALGVAAGILAVGVRRWPIVAVCGFAAAAAALAIAFAIPDQFVSTAVLQVDPPTPGLAQAVLDDAVLQRIVEKRAMNLYPDERARKPLSEVLRRMRERDLVIRETQQGIALSFRYPDRYKAQAAVREFVTTLTEWNVVEARRQGVQKQTLAVVIPANLPQTPASPNRLVILFAGLATGLAAGIVLTRQRRLRTLAV